MKKISKFLVILLVIALSVGLCPNVFADAGITSTYKAIDENGEGGVLVIGDSFGVGLGSGNFEAIEAVTSGDSWQRWVDGAYAAYVAEAVGCTREANSAVLDSTGNFWTCAMPGLPVTAVLDLLGIEDGFDDSDYYHSYDGLQLEKNIDLRSYYQRLLDYYGEVGVSYAEGYNLSENGKVGTLPDMIEKASLIVVEVGMNDIFARTIAGAMGNQEGGGSTGLANMSVDTVEKLVARLYDGLNRFQSSYPTLLSKLRALNPDATIVTTGMCNVAFNMPLTDESVLPLGTALSVIPATMNKCIKNWAKQYNTVYVDISNVDLGGSQYDLSAEYLGVDSTVVVHPTPEGHAQIARLIVNALNENSAKKTDIKLDIGHFERIDYVLVDGKAVSDFTVENNVLTVHCGTVKAKNLTVAVVDGTRLAISTYQLSYDNGYTAYRIYTTNNAVTTVNKAAAKLVSTARSLFGKLIK